MIWKIPVYAVYVLRRENDIKSKRKNKIRAASSLETPTDSGVITHELFSSVPDPYVLGLPDPDPLVTKTHKYGSGSGSFSFLIKVLSGLK